MSDITILHNPRCSKSRQTLALLEEKGHSVEQVLYLQTPPTAEQIIEYKTLLGFDSVRDFMRVKEDDYKRLSLAEVNDEMALAKAMSENPKLIERPIVIANGKAKLGRPPEQVLDIL